MSNDEQTIDPAGRDVDVRDDPEHADPPDDPRKPESPTDLTKPSLMFVLRKTAREFSRDQCTDLAAALTYYSVLSLFPALLAMVSLLGVFGQGEKTVDAVLTMVEDLGPSDAVDTLRAPVEQLVAAPSAGLALVIGLAGALWSASGYVGAFGRAMNRMYEVDEGRPIWKLRPAMLLVTLVALILAAAVALMLAVSGPVARSIGDAIGLGNTALTVWNIVRWPVVLVFVVVIVAVLYWATPNVKQPKFRWISAGAVLAIVTWIVASVAFALYVSNFGSYNKTYGGAGGRHRFPLVAVAHQSRTALRRRVRRRTRAWPTAPGGHGRRGAPTAPASRHHRLGQEREDRPGVRRKRDVPCGTLAADDHVYDVVRGFRAQRHTRHDAVSGEHRDGLRRLDDWSGCAVPERHRLVGVAVAGEGARRLQQQPLRRIR